MKQEVHISQTLNLILLPEDTFSLHKTAPVGGFSFRRSITLNKLLFLCFDSHVTQTTSWSPPGSSGGAPELTPPPQETSEVGEGCDGEAVKQRQNPTAEMKM